MTGDLGVEIVREIADREDVDATALTPPLHDVIDTDALESLFEPTATTDRVGPGAVSFSYYGYDVAVTAAGDVRVSTAETTPSGASASREVPLD
ncbi:hypothetical protein C479_11360 [Halovivax asiaticus JCM 14624]|uniref:Halobacterial output domain-containing protein n=1 Tax=Halovivax asiaticus JCM 14624 TaxID=1227490 RepID=M0BIE2_9EURY|nr:HalOD1 output domain-containing protein [Halovivax asiaticus]ELZ09414.1 hypothetical protein C479_11360 [Halovivax asiaticus JCM 14624]